MENPTPQFTPAEAPKKSNTALIITIVVIVLCCCCAAVIIGGLTMMGPIVGDVFSTINQSLQNPGVPEIPAVPEVPGLEMPSGLIPEGGYGDDLLRTNTWSYVLIAVAMSDCAAPSAGETAISVTQEPDSDGVWKEQWKVACGDGKSVPVDIIFTPSASGGTDISVSLAE